jgi:hypothetical protein
MKVKLQTKSGNNVTDTMRFFHGDSPARQPEAGQQKGGKFYCSGCGANAQQAYQLDICFSCHYLSLSDRQQLVLAGPLGRKISLAKSPKPFKNLKRDELIRELNARGIYEGDKKSELEKILAEVYMGFNEYQHYFTPTKHQLSNPSTVTGMRYLAFNHFMTSENILKTFFLNFHITFQKERLLQSRTLLLEQLAGRKLNEHLIIVVLVSSSQNNHPRLLVQSWFSTF